MPCVTRLVFGCTSAAEAAGAADGAACSACACAPKAIRPASAPSCSVRAMRVDSGVMDRLGMGKAPILSDSDRPKSGSWVRPPARGGPPGGWRSGRGLNAGDRPLAAAVERLHQVPDLVEVLGCGLAL